MPELSQVLDWLNVLYLPYISPRSPLYLLFISQVLDWLNVLLDAHFSQLLLHVPAHALLKRLATYAGRHAQQVSVRVRVSSP